MPVIVTKPAKVPATAYRQAVANTRFWWNRYRSLPRWRLLARRKALGNAQSWGEYTKQLHADESGSSELLTSKNV